MIDGQGGEPQIGAAQTWWEVNAAGGTSPGADPGQRGLGLRPLRITLHDAPKFHVKLGAKGFIVWGITIKTPARPTNSVGTMLTPSSAHNTDGVDPGQSASDGFIVYNRIGVGDDQIAIKGGTNVDRVTIAHNHFLSGHGMSIGSKTNGGCRTSWSATCRSTASRAGFRGNANGSHQVRREPGRSGQQHHLRRRLRARPDQPHHPDAALLLHRDGVAIPTYTGITIRDFRSVSSAATPKVTLLGYDAAHPLGLTLDNVVVDDLTSENVIASDANVTLGPGKVSFVPAGTNVTVRDESVGPLAPNACTGKWVTF